MKISSLLPLALLFCGCHSESTVQLWIENQADDTLVVEVARRQLEAMPVREFTIPPGGNTSVGLWYEPGICDDCSAFMEPWLWLDSLSLRSHEWVDSSFTRGTWDYRMYEGSNYRHFHHTLRVTEYDIE